MTLAQHELDLEGFLKVYFMQQEPYLLNGMPLLFHFKSQKS